MRFIFLIKWILLVSCIFSFNGSILSQNLNSGDEIQAEKIEVTESSKSKKSSTEKRDSTGFHSEILLDDQAKDRYDSLPQILEREAGLRVRQFGGLGSYSTLSIRGSNPNQSRYYVDGVPFNNSQSGEVNLADLPFDNLEAIEVYRSGVPLGFAGSAIGGVVNLRTMIPVQDKTRINLGGGSFNTGRGSYSISRLSESKEVGYTLFGIMEKSDQNFSYLNDQGTILFNTFDDTIDRRKNAQFERAQGSSSVFWNIGETDLRLFADLNHRRHGVPGPGSNQTEKTQRKYTRFTTAISTDTPEFFSEYIQLESRTYFSGFKDEFFDPKSEFSAGRPNSLANSDTMGIQISPSLYLLDYYQIIKFSMGAETEDFRRDRRNSDHQVLDKEPIRNRRFRNLQAQDEIRLFSARFLIVPGVSWDQYLDEWENDLPLTATDRYTRKNTEFTNPRLGLIWKILDSGRNHLAVKTNVNRQARIPSFLEIFGERGQILGNNNLDPERAENGDFGFEFRTYFFKIESKTEVSIFRKRIQDMILFVPNSQFSLRAENVDAAKIDGVEWNQNFNFKNWNWIVNYTYQKALNDSDSPNLKDKFLPLRPMHELFTSISYRIKSFTVGVELTYIGAVFRDRTNEYINYLPARDIYGAFFSYVFWGSYDNSKVESDRSRKNSTSNRNIREPSTDQELRINFEIKNVGDNQFEDFIGYPLPGRMWYLGVSYVF
ncbi:MAG: TonB-dependent receptor plug domain-containing protein [Leptospira sp.]|nr:TonB-dependent receptor plug domain-containing protein [Leptospira sp.]